MEKKIAVTIKLPKKTIERLNRISENSDPHISKNAAIEYCLNKSLPDLEKRQ